MKNKNQQKPIKPALSQRDVNRIAKAVVAEMHKPRPLIFDEKLLTISPLLPLPGSK